MEQERTQTPPKEHQLFAVIRGDDGFVLAFVEAHDEREANVRAAYVARRLGLGDWRDVFVVPAEGGLAEVPTIKDSFFRAALPKPSAH